MGITDIDDKIIKSAALTSMLPKDLATKYEREFITEMKMLNVRMPDVFTRVTEHIPEIVNYISKIMQHGYAYSSNGSVYFDLQAFIKHYNYGTMQGALPSPPGIQNLFISIILLPDRFDRFSSYQLNSTQLHHITSHHITSHHITSHHITSNHTTSHHIKQFKSNQFSPPYAIDPPHS